MKLDLAEVLADLRGEAAVLRKNRATFSVDRVEEFCDRVTAAAEDYLTWLSEKDAAIRSGHSEDWLRGRFEALRRDGHARLAGRARQYRACAIPRRADVINAAARGREAARAVREQHEQRKVS